METMVHILPDQIIDNSSADQFRFSIICAECGEAVYSVPVRFSKAGVMPASDGKYIIYSTLYEREKASARQLAVKSIGEHFSLFNSFGKTDEYDNQEMILEILPGAAHRVHCLYNLSNTTDPVEIQVSDMMQLSDDVVTCTFDLSGENAPAAMPGESETPEVPVIVSEGATGDFYIKFIDDSKIADDWGEEFIRVNFDFTNNSDSVTSAWASLTYYATQDGNDLSEDTFFFEEENQALMADVQPGETVRVSLIFGDYNPDGGNALVTVCDYWDEDNIINYSCPVK